MQITQTNRFLKSYKKLFSNQVLEINDTIKKIV